MVIQLSYSQTDFKKYSIYQYVLSIENSIKNSLRKPYRMSLPFNVKSDSDSKIKTFTGGPTQFDNQFYRNAYRINIQRESDSRVGKRSSFLEILEEIRLKHFFFQQKLFTSYQLEKQLVNFIKYENIFKSLKEEQDQNFIDYLNEKQIFIENEKDTGRSRHKESLALEREKNDLHREFWQEITTQAEKHPNSLEVASMDMAIKNTFYPKDSNSTINRQNVIIENRNSRIEPILVSNFNSKYGS